MADTIHIPHRHNPSTADIIKAIDKLTEYYETYEPAEIPPSYSVTIGNGTCPLCTICKDTTNPELIDPRRYHHPCAACPWVIDTDYTCVGNSYQLHTACQRLSRLRWWKKQLEDKLEQEK